jgi:hypothetical protein
MRAMPDMAIYTFMERSRQPGIDGFADKDKTVRVRVTTMTRGIDLHGIMSLGDYHSKTKWVSLTSAFDL